MAHFLHTADLHLGRAFGSIGGDKATELRAARFQVPESIARLAASTRADFVVIAGDLFDSRNPDGAVIAKAMEAIGKIPVPVYAIPGNHDPAGPYGPYDSPKFREYRDRYAPGFHLLTVPEAEVLPEVGAVLMPCPATGRPGSDPTAWLRQPDAFADLPEALSRIAVAHGGTVDFPSDVDQAAEISLQRLDRGAIDYLALGDWHGTLHIVDEAYRYSGTPEADRFPRHDDYRNGRVLEVRTARGQAPEIVEHLVGRFAWVTRRHVLRDAEAVERLDAELLSVNEQSGRLLRLELEGSLGIGESALLNRTCERLADVYLHVDIDRSGLVVKADEEELARLASDAANPTTARVAQKLAGLVDDPERGPAARLALVKLHEAMSR